MAKLKTMTVTYPHPHPREEHGTLYQVTQITDSVEYNPGDFLSKKVVETLCNDRGWKVTVKPAHT